MYIGTTESIFRTEFFSDNLWKHLFGALPTIGSSLTGNTIREKCFCCTFTTVREPKMPNFVERYFELE